MNIYIHIFFAYMAPLSFGAACEHPLHRAPDNVTSLHLKKKKKKHTVALSPPRGKLCALLKSVSLKKNIYI